MPRAFDVGRSPLIGVLVALPLIALAPSSSLADDDDKKGPVYTDPVAAGIDYQLQGEYSGWINPLGPRSSRTVALQVVARGDGEFVASKYYGGLPGRGWNGRERIMLEGTRDDGVLELTGSQHRILISDGIASVFSQDGEQIGRLVRLERSSPTLGALPPDSAVVLFDGSSTEHWQGGEITEDGWLAAGTQTARPWDDFRLHIEFRLPFKPHATGQARGNSGVYLQSRYEVQVLDAFGLEEAINESGALYKQRPPDLNMSLPPLTWQTYDIDFTPPVFDSAGNKVKNARISVWHNGVLIHNDVEVTAKTGGGKQEAPQPLPTKLQDHGNPVAYRNVWLIDRSANSALPAGVMELAGQQPPVPVGHPATAMAQPVPYPVPPYAQAPVYLPTVD